MMTSALLAPTLVAFVAGPLRVIHSPPTVSMSIGIGKAGSSSWSVHNDRKPPSDHSIISEPMMTGDQLRTTAQKLRDERLAQDDLSAWCADRCLATGYCDVVEDMLQMTTKQVQAFCDFAHGVPPGPAGPSRCG